MWFVMKFCPPPYSERLMVSPRGSGKSMTLNLSRDCRPRDSAGHNLNQAFREQEHSTRAVFPRRRIRLTRLYEGDAPVGDTNRGVRRKFPAPPIGRSKWGGGGDEVFPIDNNKRKRQARAGEEKSRLLLEGYRPPAIYANLGVVSVVFAQSIRLGPGGPVFCSDIAMTLELSLNARIFGPTILQGDADLLLAFFQGSGGGRIEPPQWKNYRGRRSSGWCSSTLVTTLGPFGTRHFRAMWYDLLPLKTARGTRFTSSKNVLPQSCKKGRFHRVKMPYHEPRYGVVAWGVIDFLKTYPVTLRNT
ncbi:hypothetical protein B0H13DRAFT_1864682 [Mycena leptocephala]|nr:hypothetical protein B0H13DRAFT_1864682 [Mycena leptocephala]